MADEDDKKLAERARAAARAVSGLGDKMVNSGADAIRKYRPDMIATEDQRASNDARIQVAKNNMEMKALPANHWMRQNVPGADWAQRQMVASTRPAPTVQPVRDGGDVDEPVRQPIQMSREFPSTPQGKADEAAYIQKAREAARRASGK